jgi:pimeloyl-ACP methyl ester carboxylesterase
MHLEVVERTARGKAIGPPILFVHGSAHAAWCWEEHFLGYFSDHGFDSLAVSLRGHGKSDTRKSLRWTSVADYVQDVRFVASRLSKPPIVVGHSLGGYIVQRYLEDFSAAGGVLLSSSPARGMFAQGLRLIAAHPLLIANVYLFLDPGRFFEKPEDTRKLLFANAIGDDEVARYSAQLGSESFRAMSEMVYRLPKVKRIRASGCPLLVLGAGEDALVSPKEVELTARAYQVPCEIFPGMGHDMMLDLGWEDVAECMRRWIENSVAAA